MQYKRNEYFRYSFNEPFEATFRLIKDATDTSPEELSKKGICQIIDISPNGLKISTEFLIAIDKLNHVEIQFTLDEAPLSRIGEFIWSHRKVGGYEYGVKLLGDIKSEQEIINELKNRRKKEMMERK